ncbi:1,2-phenylacetyl-CoA epoxidase subunit PaaD [Kitasatospora sp. NPDC049285]|uniref:1,2-phenylacetyl-CoA epoxidase subunit PaaD n=1 Tax=Kitasatospora sp. NPDC049285 TaxID=3157096 RepID=UPI003441152C
MVTTITRAWEVAAAVPDPELPMLTLADLGVLAEVEERDGELTAWLTPTYSGCPAIAEMAADVAARLHTAGFPTARVRLRLDPPWSSDRISAEGRRKLAEAGIAPPTRGGSPTPGGLLALGPTRLAVSCPQCGSTDTEELSRFGSTACKSLWRCRSCREPFDRIKEI